MLRYLATPLKMHHHVRAAAQPGRPPAAGMRYVALDDHSLITAKSRLLAGPRHSSSHLTHAAQKLIDHTKITPYHASRTPAVCLEVAFVSVRAGFGGRGI
jgi:hypothetical protein